MQLYLSRKKCYSENNTDTKAERGAKSIRRKKGGNKMEFVFEHANMIAVIAVLFMLFFRESDKEITAIEVVDGDAALTQGEVK